MIVRTADPDRDARAVVEIYRPAIEETVVSFEEVVPDAEEMAARIRNVLTHTPWLVADDGKEVVGYAYAGPHRERRGYRWSVDVSVYVASGMHRRGIGRTRRWPARRWRSLIPAARARPDHRGRMRGASWTARPHRPRLTRP